MTDWHKFPSFLNKQPFSDDNVASFSLKNELIAIGTQFDSL